MEEFDFWVIFAVSLCYYFAHFFWDSPKWLLLLSILGIIIGGGGAWSERSSSEAERLEYQRKEWEEKGKKFVLDQKLPDLIPCVTCKKKISKRADTCVGCGEKVSRSWKYYGTTEGLIELGLNQEEIELYQTLKVN